jgi:hypothetical protein
MGHHFRERHSFVQNDLSRRSILKGILAGAAAGAPVAAEAKTLTNEEELDACIAKLREILTRMHPKSTPRTLASSRYVESRPDGSWRLHMRGDVEFEDF